LKLNPIMLSTFVKIVWCIARNVDLNKQTTLNWNDVFHDIVLFSADFFVLDEFGLLLVQLNQNY